MTDAPTFSPFYQAAAGFADPEGWRRLPTPDTGILESPGGYLPGAGLVDAVNVALMLNQPLLLTGEPGTGKTRLAHSIAYQIGLEPVYSFETKSSTEAKDLFYQFDSVGRFHEAQTGGSIAPERFLTFNALGLAILRANEPDDVRDLLVAAGEEFEYGPQRSVVLIDEIDKAPRDVPNDILNELDLLFFRIAELGNRTVAADARQRPIVVITSNSEKGLPDAFLRRCVYYDLPFPDDAHLEQIIASRIGGRAGTANGLLGDCLSLYRAIRAQPLRKLPATAELIDWISLLTNTGLGPDSSLRDYPKLVESCSSTLFKTQEDQHLAPAIINDWIETTVTP